MMNHLRFCDTRRVASPSCAVCWADDPINAWSCSFSWHLTMTSGSRECFLNHRAGFCSPRGRETWIPSVNGASGREMTTASRVSLKISCWKIFPDSLWKANTVSAGGFGLILVRFSRNKLCIVVSDAELDTESSSSPGRPRLSFSELLHSRNIWKNLCVLGFTS